jgi:hypothetical protein
LRATFAGRSQATRIAALANFLSVNRGSEYMIRNFLLLALVTLPLAACDDGSGSTSTAAAQASQSVGLIDRSPAVDSSQSVAPVATSPASTPPTTVVANPPVTVVGNPPVTPVNGVATLDWQPPTENSDGTVLTNLAGYTVYYGTSPGDLSKSVKVTNPGLTAYSVTGLTSGTWYFAVTSYSADGIESTRTTIVSTKI